MEKMTLGNRIAQYRKQRNMTQEALARLLGVSNQAVSKWESDICCPDILLLPQLADVFEITMDALFGRRTGEKEHLQELPWEDDDALRAVLYHGREAIAGFALPEGCAFMMKELNKPCVSEKTDAGSPAASGT